MLELAVISAHRIAITWYCLRDVRNSHPSSAPQRRRSSSERYGEITDKYDDPPRARLGRASNGEMVRFSSTIRSKRLLETHRCLMICMLGNPPEGGWSAAGPQGGCQRKTRNLVKTTLSLISVEYPQLFCLHSRMFANCPQNSCPESRLSGRFVWREGGYNYIHNDIQKLHTCNFHASDDKSTC